MEATLVANGLNPFEISELDRDFGRTLIECQDTVEIKFYTGVGGSGGHFMKLKEEEYR